MTASLKATSLHRVEHDHFGAMALALHELKRRGFSRIAFMVSTRTERILERRYSGSFLTHHPLGSEAARKLLGIVKTITSEQMRSQVRKSRADCLLLTFSPANDTSLTSPSGDFPIFSLDVLPDDHRFSGIHQRMQEVASNAVDVVVEQLVHGRRGIPSNPKRVLTPGRWFEGGMKLGH